MSLINIAFPCLSQYMLKYFLSIKKFHAPITKERTLDTVYETGWSSVFKIFFNWIKNIGKKYSIS